jgi:hypothetical protein
MMCGKRKEPRWFSPAGPKLFMGRLDDSGDITMNRRPSRTSDLVFGGACECVGE